MKFLELYESDIIYIEELNKTMTEKITIFLNWRLNVRNLFKMF